LGAGGGIIIGAGIGVLRDVASAVDPTGGVVHGIFATLGWVLICGGGGMLWGAKQIGQVSIGPVTVKAPPQAAYQAS